ncbi:MAG: hypothetical protein KKC51_14240, partial [Verrucomicrobia bacterium]|nr:hypothetical protein [Verrucomicrobiota bacterium]
MTTKTRSAGWIVRTWIAWLGLTTLLAGEGRAETFYGMPVLETVNGYKVVDIRPILGGMTYQNAKAQYAWRNVKATSTLVGIDKRSGYPRWMTDKKYKCPRFWWYP